MKKTITQRTPLPNVPHEASIVGNEIQISYTKKIVPKVPDEAENLRARVVGNEIQISYTQKMSLPKVPDEAKNLRARAVGNEIQISYDIEVNEPQSKETILEETKGTKEWLDKYFPIVQASTLSLGDEIIQHEPETEKQKDFKERLIETIKFGLQDFRAPIMDPSLDEDGNICYEAGMMPAVGRSAVWWYENAQKFLPEKESRLGLTKERIAFLALFMKELIGEYGYTITDAWKAVCDQSKYLGHYSDSKNPKYEFEPTGSRKVVRWNDLGNTSKITKNEASRFSNFGGYFFNYGNGRPLATVSWNCPYTNQSFGLGWTVLSV